MKAETLIVSFRVDFIFCFFHALSLNSIMYRMLQLHMLEDHSGEFQGVFGGSRKVKASRECQSSCGANFFSKA